MLFLLKLQQLELQRVLILFVCLFIIDAQYEPKAAEDDEFQYLGELLAHTPAETIQVQPQRPIENQLNCYLTSAVATGFPQREEPSKFWIDNLALYPDLGAFALDVLTIQCSSAPSERLFSTAGEATAGKKNRLSGEKLEQKVFVRRNAKYL